MMTTKKRALFCLSGLLAAAALAASAAAQSDELRAGADYIALSPPQPERVAAGKIEVAEFFNFSCPHCFRLQGHFAKWRREHGGEDIAIVRQPVAFQRFRGHFARAYYTLEALGDSDDLSEKLYAAIHRERKLVNNKGRFLDWLEEDLGFDRDNAEEIYESFSVDSKATRADSIAADYGIDSTPQLAVAGKYIVNPRLSGSYERMMVILTALVERERAERAAKN